MEFPLYKLNSTEFEELVVTICEEILGTATLNFSLGKDGGRDAIFTGKARNFPSDIKPWEGMFVIEAKHTKNINASCSDSDFKSIIEKDIIPKIQKLKIQNKVDFHLTFTNRKLSGIEFPKIEDLISVKTNVTNIVLGEERIQKWLRDNPIIIKKLHLNRLLLPLEFYEEDIVEIIEIFASVDFSKSDLEEKIKEIRKIPIEEKNRLNKLSQDYFDFVYKKSYNDFAKIENFFKDPKNKIYKKQYDNTVDELQEKIIIKREEFNEFDAIFSFLYDFIFSRNIKKLKTDRNLIRLFLHYMYCMCHIGKS